MNDLNNLNHLNDLNYWYLRDLRERVKIEVKSPKHPLLQVSCHLSTMSGIHRLEGSRPVAGGLVIKKKKSDADDEEESSKGVKQSSLLGLDRLAELKEKEKLAFKRPSDDSNHRYAVEVRLKL